MESMFFDWLKGQGVELDAMIFTSPKDWCPDLYIFRFRYSGSDWSSHQTLTWGMDTFVLARNLIDGARP